MRRTAQYLIDALPLWIALLAYGYAIDLPLFADDAPNFWLVENINGLEQWLGSYSFPFYRPAVFSIWKFSQWLHGGHDAPFLHLINVLAYGMAGVFLALWAKRLTRNRLAGLLAGTAFVIFPTNYQAVNFVSSLFHIVSALGFTAALWLTLAWLERRPGWGVLVLAWGMALIGIFSHENGVLLPLFMGGMAVLLARRGTPHWRRWWLAVSVPSASASLYLLAWLFLPRADSTEIALSSGFGRSINYLTHQLVYMVAALVQRFVPGEEATLPFTLGLIAVVLIPLLLLVFVRRPYMGWVALFGLVWYGLAILPAVLLLDPGYIYDSQRLALLASVGAGLFYGVVASTLWGWNRFGKMIASGLIALSVLVSARFLWLRMDDYQRMATYADQLFEATLAVNAPQNGTMIVNSPNFITRIGGARIFLTGSENVQFMTPEVGYDLYLWVNTGQQQFLQADIQPFAYLNTLARPSPSELYVPYFPPQIDSWETLIPTIQDAPPIITTAFNGNRFHPVYVGNTDTPAPIDTPLADAPDAALVIRDAQATYADQTVKIEIDWQATDTPPAVLRVIHLMCEDRLVQQVDGDPWAGLYPFLFWEAGEVQRDRYVFFLDESAAIDPACLRVNLSLVRADNRDRIPLINPKQGEPYPNGLLGLAVK